MKTDDVIATLQQLNLIQYQKGQHVVCAAPHLVEMNLKKVRGGGREKGRGRGCVRVCVCVCLRQLVELNTYDSGLAVREGDEVLEVLSSSPPCLLASALLRPRRPAGRAWSSTPPRSCGRRTTQSGTMQSRSPGAAPRSARGARVGHFALAILRGHLLIRGVRGWSASPCLSHFPWRRPPSSSLSLPPFFKENNLPVCLGLCVWSASG
jgi:hypothetical protein